ncbi:HIRAN domain-containing protein [Myroides marinus]|uniref:HIRAN domain-containing protein n=1 Tax=Myroides marinus TaxID=703342 RepID=UPI002578033C|nr:HIRAN domain-containing protein [Myroides marinus]MDM1361861.1 hypothetical protein [Myroides marinus]MDM1373139.1 hypothetical protein [Myroides marinus]
MRAIAQIYLVWRKGSGGRRHIVGSIKRNATEGVRFEYIKENVEEAKKDGFVLYESFPDLDKKYTENVLDIFGQRIMRSDRGDLKNFYDFWKIDQKNIDDKYYMLAYTQGMLPTDNYEFLADFNPVKGLKFVTEISGLSHSKVSSDQLSVGDKLSYLLEPNNPKDKNAIKIFKGDLSLGYIKRVHNSVFVKTKHQIDLTVQSIEKNGILKRVFVEVEIL